MKANQAEFKVKTMARVLLVSTSGFYDWKDRGLSKRALANEALVVKIKAAHAMSDATYGMPRIRAEIIDQGCVVGKHRVARLMHIHHIRGVCRRRGFITTTNRNRIARAAPDLVKRQFFATLPNQLWVADMTYIPTWEGFTYLATVLDVFSRKIVGWAFSNYMTSDVVIKALDMALATRRPESSVIHHSDQGSQYTSIEFGRRCKEMNVQPSMGTVGDAYDNAMAESFFAILECELIDRRSWPTKREAQSAIFTWIETWYNSKRRHSALNYLSPINFERQYALSKTEKEQTKQTIMSL
jgi:putative transposase